jgi:YfiH family protein
MRTAGAGDPAAVRRVGSGWILPDPQLLPAGVAALATTRRGGVSTGRFASLNLGAGRAAQLSGDDPAAIAENRRRVQALLPSPPVWLMQVHGTAVHVADATAGPAAPVADAAVTRSRNVVLAVLTADCLPLVLADRDGVAVGIAHCGWRGVAAGVVENTVRALAIPPQRIVAWMGPAIGPDAFEVGADVRDAFMRIDAHDAAAFRAKGPGKWWADLYALARQRLVRCGVSAIAGGDHCTVTEADRFFSHRRDGDTGRLATFAWLR